MPWGGSERQRREPGCDVGRAARPGGPDMKPAARLSADELRGLGRLGVDAVREISALVEAVHGGVQRVATLRAPRTGKGPDPIARLAYAGVRGVAGLVGWSLEQGARRWAQAAGPPQPAADRAALQAALNGVLGDHLARSGNPLAIPLRLWHQGRPLPLDDAPAIRAALTGAEKRYVVLLHGLCMTPWQWQRADAGSRGPAGAADGIEDIGALAAALGFTVLHLQYNSGRRITETGADLAIALDRLFDALPSRSARLVLVGHSMGGLVARAACQRAARQGLGWLDKLSALICLGTPHHGAPLERAGHGVERLLEALPLVSPFARLARVRSAGITDLRHGAIGADAALTAGLPPSVELHALAATLSRSAAVLRPRSDGLVPVASALGRHRDPRRDLGIPEARQALVADVGHIGLLHHPETLRIVRDWLSSPPR